MRLRGMSDHLDKSYNCKDGKSIKSILKTCIQFPHFSIKVLKDIFPVLFFIRKTITQRNRHQGVTGII